MVHVFCNLSHARPHLLLAVLLARQLHAHRPGQNLLKTITQAEKSSWSNSFITQYTYFGNNIIDTSYAGVCTYLFCSFAPCSRGLGVVEPAHRVWAWSSHRVGAWSSQLDKQTVKKTVVYF